MNTILQYYIHIVVTGIAMSADCCSSITVYIHGPIYQRTTTPSIMRGGPISISHSNREHVEHNFTEA